MSAPNHITLIAAALVALSEEHGTKPFAALDAAVRAPFVNAAGFLAQHTFGQEVDQIDLDGLAKAFGTLHADLKLDAALVAKLYLQLTATLR